MITQRYMLEKITDLVEDTAVIWQSRKFKSLKHQTNMNSAMIRCDPCDTELHARVQTIINRFTLSRHTLQGDLYKRRCVFHTDRWFEYHQDQPWMLLGFLNREFHSSNCCKEIMKGVINGDTLIRYMFYAGNDIGKCKKSSQILSCDHVCIEIVADTPGEILKLKRPYHRKRIYKVSSRCIILAFKDAYPCLKEEFKCLK